MWILCYSWRREIESAKTMLLIYFYHSTKSGIEEQQKIFSVYVLYMELIGYGLDVPARRKRSGAKCHTLAVGLQNKQDAKTLQRGAKRKGCWFGKKLSLSC